MSELQKKLARRRELNGEPGGGAGNVAETSNSQSTPIESKSDLYSASSLSTTSSVATPYVSNQLPKSTSSANSTIKTKTNNNESIPLPADLTTSHNLTARITGPPLNSKPVAINSSNTSTCAGANTKMTAAKIDAPSTVGCCQAPESKTVLSVDPVTTLTTSPEKSRPSSYRQTASTSPTKRLSTSLSRSTSPRLGAVSNVGTPSNSPSKRVSGSKNMAAQLMQYQKSKDLSPEKKSAASESTTLTAKNPATHSTVSASSPSTLMTATPGASSKASVSSIPVVAKSNFTASSQPSQSIPEISSADSVDSAVLLNRRKSVTPGKLNIQGLNINVEALKPGAKLPNLGSSTSTITSPPTTRIEVTPTELTTSISEAYVNPILSQSKQSVEGNEELNHINMQRPIINSRRRAQSRNLDKIREDGSLSGPSSRLPSIDECNASSYDFLNASSVSFHAPKTISSPPVVTTTNPPAKPIKPSKYAKSPVLSSNDPPSDVPITSLTAQPIRQTLESMVKSVSGDSGNDSSAGTAPSQSLDIAQIEQRIRDIYTVHNPDKLAELPMLLQRSRGSEDVLLARIEAKYVYKCPPPNAATSAALPAALGSAATAQIQEITAAKNGPSRAYDESILSPTSEKMEEIKNKGHVTTELSSKKTVAVLSSKGTTPTTTPSHSIKTTVPTIATAINTSVTAPMPYTSVRTVHSSAVAAKIPSPLQTARSDRDHDDGPSSARSNTSVASTDSTKSSSTSPVPTGVQPLSKVHGAARGSIVRSRASSLLASPHVPSAKEVHALAAETTSDSLAEFEIDDSGADSLMLSLDNVYKMDQNGSKSEASESQNVAALKEIIASLKNQNSILEKQLRLREVQVSELEREVAELKDMVLSSGSGLERGPGANEYGVKTRRGDLTSKHLLQKHTVSALQSSIQEKLQSFGISSTINLRLEDSTTDLSIEQLLPVSSSGPMSPQGIALEVLLNSHSLDKQVVKSAWSNPTNNDALADSLTMKDLLSPVSGYGAEQQQLFAERNNDRDHASSSQDTANASLTDASYQDFLDRLAHKDSMPLVDVIRRFLDSVLGPLGNGIPPLRPDPAFVGSAGIVRRCGDFFDAMMDHFRAHPLWKNEDLGKLMATRDCLERYVMTRLYQPAWSAVHLPERDEHFTMRCKVLSFLQPEALDIKPQYINELVWNFARDELRLINLCKAPGDKANCVVRCVSILFRSLSLSNAAAESNLSENHYKGAGSVVGSNNTGEIGADDFLPIFIWVVLTSNVTDLMSNCEYIQAFHNPFRLMGRTGYCLVNLQSAAEFIDSLEADSVTMSPKDFNAKLAEATAQLSMPSPSPIVRTSTTDSGNEVTVAATTSELITASRVVSQDYW